MRKFLEIIATISVLLAVLVGCSSTDAFKSSGSKVRIVAGFYPLAFVAEKIGGSHVVVENLTRSGVEPHDLELTPTQVASLTRADIVFYIKGFNPAIDNAIEQSSINNAVDVSSLEESTSVENQVIGNDPHIWQDPMKYAQAASILAKKISAIDPKNSKNYDDNLISLKTSLNNLDLEFRSGLTSCDRREIVTSHSAFGYLAKRYKLLQIGILGLSPDAEPSPKRLNEIAVQIRRDKITTIFFESMVSPKVAQTLASDLKVKTALLDPIEGVSKGQTYFTVMEQNLASLREALGCK